MGREEARGEARPAPLPLRPLPPHEAVAKGADVGVVAEQVIGLQEHDRPAGARAADPQGAVDGREAAGEPELGVVPGHLAPRTKGGVQGPGTDVQYHLSQVVL
jgi:hypothetical protein